MFFSFSNQLSSISSIHSLQYWELWIKQLKHITKKKRFYIHDIHTIANLLLQGKYEYNLPIDSILHSFLEQINMILQKKQDLQPYIYNSNWYHILQSLTSESEQSDMIVDTCTPTFFLFSYLVSFLQSQSNRSLTPHEIQSIWNTILSTSTS
jgi:hypothetical protein